MSFVKLPSLGIWLQTTYGVRVERCRVNPLRIEKDAPDSRQHAAIVLGGFVLETTIAESNLTGIIGIAGLPALPDLRQVLAGFSIGLWVITSGLRVVDNAFHGTYAGIKLRSVPQQEATSSYPGELRFAGNLIELAGLPRDAEGAVGVRSIERVGLEIMGTIVTDGHVDIENNHIRVNDAGVAIHLGVGKVRVLNNDIFGTKGKEKGIWFSKSKLRSVAIDNVQLIGNRILNVNEGIVVKTAIASAVIKHNAIESSSSALFVEGTVEEPVGHLAINNNQFACNTAPGINIAATSAIVIGNHVQIQGEARPAPAIQLNRTNATVLGNITTAPIEPHNDSWEQLNVVLP